MEVLHFIFRGPGTFFGVLILLFVLLDGLASIAKAIRGERSNANREEE